MEGFLKAPHLATHEVTELSPQPPFSMAFFFWFVFRLFSYATEHSIIVFYGSESKTLFLTDASIPDQVLDRSRPWLYAPTCCVCVCV